MSPHADLDPFLHRAIELGAVGAKVIESATISTAAWVRLKCQFGCAGYNRRLGCPPYSPTPQETREVIDCYQRAILIQCKENIYPTGIAVSLEREIFLNGFYKALAFGAGPCRLCEQCNLEHCAHPNEARPAMEACGIDVFATARANGFRINVVRDHTCDQNHYGLVLVD